MNERIGELYEQAHIERRQEYFSSVVDPTIKSVSVTRHFNPDLFAELIVRECLQQCEQVRDDAYTQKKSEYLTESGRLIYEGVFGGATNCGFAIQQHFGVKE